MIIQYIAIKHDGRWKRQSVRRTNRTEETVPALNKWIRGASDNEAVYFCNQGERPSPPVPPANAVLEEVTLTPEQLEKIKATGCGCGKKNTAKTPDTQCWECAEKHFGTAYSLYTEIGYKAINKLHCIGELASAVKHIAFAAPEFAEKLRTLRHDVQQGIDIPSSRWEALAEEFYSLYRLEGGK